VVSGGLDSADGRVAEGSSLIVEAGVPAVVRPPAATRVVHFGPMSTTTPSSGLLGPTGAVDRGLQHLRAQDVPSIRFSGDDATSVYFQDGTCPTCRITLFPYDGSLFSDDYVGASHLRSGDEIMHVLDGELHVGPLVVGAGTSIAARQTCATASAQRGRFVSELSSRHLTAWSSRDPPRSSRWWSTAPPSGRRLGRHPRPKAQLSVSREFVRRRSVRPYPLVQTNSGPEVASVVEATTG
jgi:hypothetical protein